MSIKIQFHPLLAIIGLGFLGVCHEANESVYKYNEETFHLKIPTYNHYILFFTPWDSESKAISLDWDEIGYKYNHMEDSPVKVAKVDCSTEEKLCSEQFITEYPTVKLFKVGSSSDGGVLRVSKFRGVKDQISLEQFIHLEIDKNTQALYGTRIEVPKEPLGGLHILHDETFEYALKGVKNVFVNFCASWNSKCKSLEKIWQQMSIDFQNEDQYITAKIDCISQKVTCQDYSIKSFPTLVWFQNGEVAGTFPEKEYSAEKLGTFVAKMLGKKEYKPKKELDDETLNRLMNEDEEEEGSYKTNVIVLDKNTFNKKIKKDNSLYFVNFHTPWCSDCQPLDPVWENLAELFAEKELKALYPINIAKMDCARNKQFCDDQEKVEEYPTLNVYRNGILESTYNGPLKLLALSQYITKTIYNDNKDEATVEVEGKDEL